MAHRKPLGTTCTITFQHRHWQGPWPELGDYLVSSAGTAYRVVGIEESARSKRMVCERVAEAGGDGEAFEFHWLSRDRRAA